MTDAELLGRFVRARDEQAFAALVRRHVNLVYAAASRHVNGDVHLAEEVAQQVFIDLTRKAQRLVEHPCLAGWLYASTRFVAINEVRVRQRRTGRESNAEVLMEQTPVADWDRIRPVIDDALHELEERDREFVLLRFFGQQSFAAIAQQFNVSENAAQKAVARALDLLGGALAKRGITSTAAALTVALDAAAMTAPATLVSTLVTTIIGGGTGIATSAASLGTAVKLGLALAVVASVAGVAGYWHGRARQGQANTAQLASQDGQYRERVRQLETVVAAERRRTAAAEADTALLLQQIKRAGEERTRVVAVAGAAARVEPVDTAPRTTTPTAYIVRRGDVPAQIARRYGLRTVQLSEANPGTNFARLAVGQQIALPAGALVDPLSPAALYEQQGKYAVNPGDTLEEIALRTNVSAADLQRLNPEVNWAQLTTGQLVRLR